MWQNMLWTVPTVQVMMITAFAMVSVVDESLRKFFGAVGCLTSNKLLDFGGDPVHNLDPDFFKQFFLQGDQLLWRRFALSQVLIVLFLIQSFHSFIFQKLIFLSAFFFLLSWFF